MNKILSILVLLFLSSSFVYAEKFCVTKKEEIEYYKYTTGKESWFTKEQPVGTLLNVVSYDSGDWVKVKIMHNLNGYTTNMLDCFVSSQDVEWFERVGDYEHAALMTVVVDSLPLEINYGYESRNSQSFTPFRKTFYKGQTIPVSRAFEDRFEFFFREEGPTASYKLYKIEIADKKALKETGRVAYSDSLFINMFSEARTIIYGEQKNSFSKWDVIGFLNEGIYTVFKVLKTVPSWFLWVVLVGMFFLIRAVCIVLRKKMLRSKSFSNDALRLIFLVVVFNLVGSLAVILWEALDGFYALLAFLACIVYGFWIATENNNMLTEARCAFCRVYPGNISYLGMRKDGIQAENSSSRSSSTETVKNSSERYEEEKTTVHRNDTKYYQMYTFNHQCNTCGARWNSRAKGEYLGKDSSRSSRKESRGYDKG